MIPRITALLAAILLSMTVSTREARAQEQADKSGAENGRDFKNSGDTPERDTRRTGVTVINTPTAYTVGRNAYSIGILNYDEGGLELKSFIGLHDMIHFGISFNMRHALGNGVLQPGIPGAVVKIKLVDHFTYVPAIAIGYESWYEGTNGNVDRAQSMYNRIMNGPYFMFINPFVYEYRKRYRRDLYYNEYNTVRSGPYLVFTVPVYIVQSPFFINWGVRIPVQPVFSPKDSSYFFGLDIPLGEYFRLKGEAERIFWNFRKPGEWIFNCGVRVTFFDQLGIEFDLLIEPGERLNRILKVEYHGEF